jgi:hypothetical protein
VDSTNGYAAKASFAQRLEGLVLLCDKIPVLEGTPSSELSTVLAHATGEWKGEVLTGFFFFFLSFFLALCRM